MERELLVTGIGGQGIQLAALVIARAALAEGREVQLFGSYGGMMRGGNTEATLVVADGSVESPPTVTSAWSAIVMHHDYSKDTFSRLQAGSVLMLNSSVFERTFDRDPYVVVDIPATDIAVELGNIMTASMVMVGAYSAVTGLARIDSLVDAVTAALPAYRAQHAALNQDAIRAGYEAAPDVRVDAWEGALRATATVLTRGTVVIDVEACKGCDLCIDACPPRVLVMTEHVMNNRGYRYPLLLAGCTGCRACAQICPDFVFQVYKYDTPIQLEVQPAGGNVVTTFDVTNAPTRELLEGSEAIAQAMIVAGCRFFAGYPMTPFTEVLEEMASKLAAVDGVCMNAESELEAIGMAWGAAATGTPAATGSTGQGLSLMQESLAEMSLARVPLVVLNMARAQGDYWQATRGGGHGDYRLPVLAPMDVAEAVHLTQLAFHLAWQWRNPVMIFGDYYLAHTTQSVAIERVDFGALPPTDWALDGSSGGSGNARLVSPLGTGKQRDTVGYNLAQHYDACAQATAEMLAGIEPLVDTGFVDDAEVVVVAFGTPGRYVRAAVRSLRADGAKVGWVRPISLVPFPTDALVAAAEGARAVAVYENNQGQMIDDVRLAVLGRCPVHFIGGLSLDSSGFGIAPDLEVGTLRARIEEVLG